MTALSIFWLFLLGLRECANIFTASTTILTISITTIQLFHLLLLLQYDDWYLKKYHLLIIWFVLCTAYNSGSLPTFNIVLSFILLKNIPVKKISLVMVLAFLFTFFVYLSALSLGILQDSTTIYRKGLTHSLGFRNSNTPGLLFMMFTLIASTNWLLHSKIKFPLLLLLIPNYIIYRLTLGRTSFFTVCIYFFLVYYFSSNRKYYLERKLSIAFPILLFTVTFIFLHVWYKIPFVNVFFTGRFRINGNTLKSLSLVNYLFGYKIPEGPMDSAYLGILLNGGIFSVFFFLSSCVKGIKNMPDSKMRLFLPFILVYLLSGFTEGTFSLFRLATVLFYKCLSDQFSFSYVRAKYLKNKEL